MSDSIPTLGLAARILAGRCDFARTLDGAGFNRFDADFGHTLAHEPEEDWTPRMARGAWKMLRKYRGQLEGAGVDFDEIPESTRQALRFVWIEDVHQALDEALEGKRQGGPRKPGSSGTRMSADPK